MASKALSTWESFSDEMVQRENDIASMLPRHVSKERFMAAAVAAVKQNPALLEASPRSLMAAVTKSAQDGLLPDGREGVITVYNEKKKNGNKEYWEKTAQWNPMSHGLRKRAKELDNIIIDAQVVHEGDDFSWDQGDDPRLVHRPAKLGTPRGAMIGAYAIFKKDGVILHREVMDSEQIEAVRSQSKSPGGLLWTKFQSEGWRKSVLRRGIKSVPVSESLQTIIQRDDDNFAFDEPPLAHTKTKANVVQGSPRGSQKALPPVAGEENDIPVVDLGSEGEMAPADKQPSDAITSSGSASMEDIVRPPDELLLELEEALLKTKDQGEIGALAKKYLAHPALSFPGDQAKIRSLVSAAADKALD